MSNWDKYLTKGIPVPEGINVPLRKELNEVSDEEMFLFIEGLKRFQKADINDPLSYYQIAGIHGLPYTTWPSKTWNKDIKQVPTESKNQFGGFCTHSSILFLSWHRPYLALFESALYAHVNEVANSIDVTSPDKPKYQQIAKNFRMPYWDWARKDVSPFPKSALNSKGLPNNKVFFKSPGFNPPKMTKYSEVIDDYNPLFTFPFPAGADSQIKTVDFYTGEGENRRWIDSREYESTQRYPKLSGESTPNEVLTKMLNFFSDQGKSLTESPNLVPRNPERNLSERVAYILKAYQRFGPMCYNEFPGAAKGETGKAEIWGSLEDIHNSVHGLIGNGGHMGMIAKSAFDPIFWLHHTNIDRLFAIWQALHESTAPETYVTKQTAKHPSFAKLPDFKEDRNTPLWPFRITLERNGWWTAELAKRTEVFGYAYRETDGWQYGASGGALSDARAKLIRTINKNYTNLADFVSLSKRNVKTAGAVLLPQSALLRKLDETRASANITEMRRIDAELPEPQVLLQQSLAPEKPVLRDLAPTNKYLEWIVDIKAEKHAFDGDAQVHIFLGPVEEENFSLWPFSPNHVGTFVPLGQGDQTACAKCQQDQADHAQVTGQIPLTLALAERYLAEMIPDLTEETVIPYLKTNLHWRVALANGGTVPNRGAVPGLKVFVVSNEVTLSDDPDTPPIYAPDVKIYPEITTKVTTNGDEQGRGEGSGLTAGELSA